VNDPSTFNARPEAVFQSGTEILTLDQNGIRQYSCVFNPVVCKETLINVKIPNHVDISLSNNKIVLINDGNLSWSNDYINYFVVPGNFSPNTKCLVVGDDIFVATKNLCV
jgi:hypothetical protein